MKKIFIFMFAGLLCMFFGGFCAGQGDLEEAKIKTAEGNAAQIDPVGQTIVVSVYENDIAFSVNEDTKIMRGEEEISINDIDVNDYLLIRYYDSETPPYVASSIVDSNLANE